jgi:hypothetical protein
MRVPARRDVLRKSNKSSFAFIRNRRAPRAQPLGPLSGPVSGGASLNISLAQLNVGMRCVPFLFDADHSAVFHDDP